jgi:outer membrane immunogenic protein
MKTIILIGGVAVAATIAGIPTPAAAADFTGPRIEAHAGWDRVRAESAPLKVDDRRDGIVYGVAAGYDVALGDKVIAGIEVGFDLSDVDFASTAGTTQSAVEVKRDISVSGRIGARVADDVMVYAKAGYSNARLEAVITTGATKTAITANGDGVRVGGGIELALGPNAYAKAEYRYTDYEGGVSRHQALTGLGFRF